VNAGALRYEVGATMPAHSERSSPGIALARRIGTLHLVKGYRKKVTALEDKIKSMRSREAELLGQPIDEE
jgi:hypothetical protein